MGLLVDLIQEVAKQQGHWTSCGPFVATLVPGGTRNIQMRPRIFISKAGQETGRRGGAGSGGTDVGYIGKVGFELFLIRIIYGQRPGWVIGLSGGFEQLIFKALIVTK